MKYYAGLDVSNKTTNICVLDENDQILFETVCPTEPGEIVSNLAPYADSIDTVGLETGSLSFWLADKLRESGLPAKCLDARKVSSILKTTINKTDKNDARGIAQILRSKFYSVVHQKSKESIEIGLLMTLRSKAVSDRTGIKNCIRGTLKAYGIRIKTSGTGSFIEAVEVAIEGLPEVGRKGIHLALNQYRSLDGQVKEYDKLVLQIQKECPIVQLLQTVGGVGPITALSFVAEIDDPSRFQKNPEDIGAYLGLTPRQYSSGESTRLGGISKSGSPSVRAHLYEAAVVLLKHTKTWSKLKSWGLRLCKRKPFKVAATAVARKLAVILIKMWLRGETFRFTDQPKKAA